MQACSSLRQSVQIEVFALGLGGSGLEGREGGPVVVKRDDGRKFNEGGWGALGGTSADNDWRKARHT